MEIRYLLKSQANQLFQAIRNAELEPFDFEWQDAESLHSDLTVSQLVHKPTGYLFQFDNEDNFHSAWSPARQAQYDMDSTEEWSDQLQWFINWLSYLKRETESPDLWDAISNEAQILESAASADMSNAPFTAEQKTYIVRGIDEIKQFLLTAHKLDPELVVSRLDYLVEASERVGRKDWINLLISVLVGIVISAALPPETTRELFRFVGTVLKQIINQPLLLL